MINVRRAQARFHERRRTRELWRTFDPLDRTDPFADGFGALAALDDNLLSPGADIPDHARDDAEIVTYVSDGAVVYEDSIGHSGVIRAGEFQCITPAHGVRQREANASVADWARVFQIRLRPAEAELEPNREQKRFSAAERRGMLCVVASHDARRGSLRLHQDARMYSAMLQPGQHVVHELAPERAAWLHLVEGEVILGGIVLTAGDGAGLTTERAVSLTARQETEILLFDVASNELAELAARALQDRRA